MARSQPFSLERLRPLPLAGRGAPGAPRPSAAGWLVAAAMLCAVTACSKQPPASVPGASAKAPEAAEPAQQLAELEAENERLARLLEKAERERDAARAALTDSAGPRSRGPASPGDDGRPELEVVRLVPDEGEGEPEHPALAIPADSAPGGAAGAGEPRPVLRLHGNEEPKLSSVFDDPATDPSSPAPATRPARKRTLSP